MNTKKFKQSCKAMGLDAANCLPDVSKMPAHLQDIVTAVAEMVINAEVINDGWEYHPGESYWFPVFEYTDSGWCYMGTDDGLGGGCSLAGAPIFKTQKKAEYAANAFIKTYNRMMRVKK